MFQSSDTLLERSTLFVGDEQEAHELLYSTAACYLDARVIEQCFQ